jgi:chemosensory pili system protein ChpA (sensor histidine kinase/response regulator)
VGMDVVAQEVARLHGSVELASQSGRGTTLTVRLSARVAVEQAMVVRVAGRAFALPLVAIDLVQSLAPADRDATAIQLHDHSVRLLSARKALGLPSAGLPDRPKLLLIKAEGRELALVVDEIEGPRELVIKPMGPLLAGHPLIAGTSLSPAGELILALDPYGLVRCGSVATGTAEVQPKRPRRVLVVDDALSVRRVARRHLGSLGLETDEAADGIEALHKMRTNSYRLVLTDLEMPRMDGFELLAELRRSGASAATPVVVTSTRSDPQTLRRVLQLGARALLPKPIVPDALAVLIGSLLRQTPGDLTAPLPLVATPGR